MLKLMLFLINLLILNQLILKKIFLTKYILINTFNIYNFFELNKKRVKISISYNTNFKPSDFLFFNDVSIFKKKLNKNKIVSRNFFLFLILLKYTNNNILSNFNISVFVKPFFKKFITLLRAPYRYKLSRHQFVFNRYNVLLSINNYIEEIYFEFNKDLILFVKTYKVFYTWFESNIVSQHHAKIIFSFYIDNFFKIF